MARKVTRAASRHAAPKASESELGAELRQTRADLARAQALNEHLTDQLAKSQAERDRARRDLAERIAEDRKPEKRPSPPAQSGQAAAKPGAAPAKGAKTAQPPKKLATKLARMARRFVKAKA